MTLEIERNGAVVIERGYNTTTGDWFSVWSDGWIEQGGMCKVTSSETQKIKLKRPYKNSTFAAYCSLLTARAGLEVAAFSPYGKEIWIVVQNATEENPVFVEWEAKGY